MKKVLFLYMSKGSADPANLNDDWKDQTAGPAYEEYEDECYFKMFKDLLEEGTIKDLTVVFEFVFLPNPLTVPTTFL